MEAEDPLSQLRDIHLPGAVTLWPPAPGWWLLLVLFLIGLTFLYRKAIAAMIQRRKLASVLRELDLSYEQYGQQLALNSDGNQAGLTLLAQINTILKRVTLVMFPDAHKGQISGTDWLVFLDSCDNTSVFSLGPGQVLADGIYRRTLDAEGDGDMGAIYNLSKTWIEKRYQDKSSAEGLFHRKEGPSA